VNSSNPRLESDFAETKVELSELKAKYKNQEEELKLAKAELSGKFDQMAKLKATVGKDNTCNDIPFNEKEIETGQVRRDNGFFFFISRENEQTL
jgi:hypothetical protein